MLFHIPYSYNKAISIDPVVSETFHVCAPVCTGKSGHEHQQWFCSAAQRSGQDLNKIQIKVLKIFDKLK